MKPLSDWQLYVERTSVAEFRATFPHPFLVLSVTQTLSPVDRTRGLTIDRAIVPGADPRALVSVEDYRAVPVRSLHAGAKQVSIGCSSQCDIQINDASVSKLHAHLVEHADGWHVVDAASLMGTRVNDEDPGPAPLEPGDRITIGLVDVVFLNHDGLYHLVQRLAKATVSKQTAK